MQQLIIGSRGSDLALWQANYLSDQLKNNGVECTIRIIKTQGDRIQHISLEKLEGKGFFTKEIEDALLDGSIDVAVHSHKDLPTASTPGLLIAAVSYREDPSELILIRKEKTDTHELFDLCKNAIVGTSSSRRNVQLKFFRPDIECKDIRGNVPSRINKLRSGDYDAIVLAAAGVQRLQLDVSDLHVIKVPPQKIIPAPAQGVLAYQCRENDEKVLSVLKLIHDPQTAAIIEAERRVMQLFNGGCHMPLGAYCERAENGFKLWTMQADGRESKVRRIFQQGEKGDLMAENIFRQYQMPTGKKVLVTTQADEASLFFAHLKNHGFHITAQSFVNYAALPVNDIPKGDWLFFTSRNAVKYFFDQTILSFNDYKIAAIGSETADAITGRGFSCDFIAGGDPVTAAELFNERYTGKVVIFPSAQNASHQLRDLIAQQNTIINLPVYSNVPAGKPMPQADILVFTSPLNVDGFLLENSIYPQQQIIAMGNTTRQYLAEKGVDHVLVPPEASLLSISDMIAGM